MRHVEYGSTHPIVVRALQTASGAFAACTSCTVTVVDPDGFPLSAISMVNTATGRYLGYFNFVKAGVYRLHVKVVSNGQTYSGTSLVNSVRGNQMRLIKQQEGVRLIKEPGQRITVRAKAKDPDVAAAFTNGTITFSNASGQVVHTAALALADGTFTGFWDIPTSVMYGTYTAHLTLKTATDVKTTKIVPFEVKPSMAY